MYRAFCVLLLAAAASATTYSNCTDPAVQGPAIVSLNVVGCDVEPCLLVRGQMVDAEVTFRTKIDTSTLQSTIRAKVDSVITDFPLPEPNACLSLVNAECPLVAGETAVYRLLMPVLDIYPLVDLTIENTLTGDDGTKISCFYIRARVVRP